MPSRIIPDSALGKVFVAIGIIFVTIVLTNAYALRESSSTSVEQLAFVLDVNELTGKTPEEVEEILGAPSEIGVTRVDGVEHPEIRYKSGLVDVAFVNGVADWITIYEPVGVGFGTSALSAFGLSSDPAPSFANDQTIRWENFAHPAMTEIFLFSDGGDGISFIEFRHQTDPAP